MDDDDDGPRPGKRSCTMKTTVSPQPSPTLIECPEPGCDKKYKHINGLRYHQAHAHLEEVSMSNSETENSRTSSHELNLVFAKLQFIISSFMKLSIL